MNMSTRYILVIATAGLLIAATETKPGDVTEARVIAEATTGNDWLVGGRTFDEQHFSPLKQITDRTSGSWAWHGPPTSRARWGWRRNRSSWTVSSM